MIYLQHLVNEVYDILDYLEFGAVCETKKRHDHIGDRLVIRILEDVKDRDAVVSGIASQRFRRQHSRDFRFIVASAYSLDID